MKIEPSSIPIVRGCGKEDSTKDIESKQPFSFRKRQYDILTDKRIKSIKEEKVIN